MSKYTVKLSKTSIHIAEIEVEATSESDAERKAMDKANESSSVDWELEEEDMDVLETSTEFEDPEDFEDEEELEGDEDGFRDAEQE